MGNICLKHWTSLLLLAAAAWPTEVLAKKTSAPIYEDPFDLAAGGASLTRGAKDGIIFANPAVLPLGKKFHRWAGNTVSVLANRESMTTARQLASAGKGGGSAEQAQKLLDAVFANPIHLGANDILSWLTNNFAVAAFSRFEPDIQARRFGSTGLPEVEFQAESYQGLATSLAWQPGLRWLSFGLTLKYVYAAEPDLYASITDQDQIKQFASPTAMRSAIGMNKGMGADAGFLMFFQGLAFDLSLAGKVDDIGGTKLSGPSTSPSSFKQVASAGAGISLHTGADAIHMAVDYRDVQGAYHEAMFKRLHAGTKVTLRTYLGLAAGFYDGYPTAGAELDLIIMRLGFSTYTRELGDHPGVNPRHIYMASFSMGK